ncbi:MAG: DUF1573 domain-containing protein [Chitinophagaceae bacterium]|nr:DUF1573 domain-containing protein [Chitinophagaceae bacterium]
MNKFLALLFTACAFFSCDIRHTKSQTNIASADPSVQIFKDSTSVQVIDSAYNFGKATDGEKVEYNYRFKNTGNKPLIISSATASCGCTVPEKPDEPVKPGEIGFLKVVFDSKGRVGDVHKEITVISNAYPAFPKLQLKGEVIAKETK